MKEMKNSFNNLIYVLLEHQKTEEIVEELMAKNFPKLMKDKT